MKTCFDCQYLCQDEVGDFVCTAERYEDLENREAENCPDFNEIKN